MDSGAPRTFVLDCTLRDGGFYTDWDFSMDLAEAYVSAMDAAGVDIVEIGYRSPNASGYAGQFKYASDELAQRLGGVLELEFAVMLDTKDFVGSEAVAARMFAPADESRIHLVRFAGRAEHIDTSCELASILNGLGYRTSINLMAWASMDRDAQREALERLGSSMADVVYIADSFGGMHPGDIADAASLMDAIGDKQWGVHLHNNLELAFANALTATELGASWVDTSVLGMGRGPGNLRTELWLQHLATRVGDSRYQTDAVYDFIGDYLRPLQEEHGWGPGPAYVLSGNLGVHPTFAQRLLETGRYTVGEMISVLEHLHHTGHGASYARDALDRAISLRHQRPRQDTNGTEIVDVQRLPEADWAGREVLVVGRGPLLDDHVAAVNDYIRSHDPIVIECNYLPEVQCASDHYCAFILLANARAMVRSARAAGKSVIVGYAGSPVDLGRISVQDDPCVFWEPYQIQRDALSFEDQCVIPHDVVSMFCIGQAVAHGAHKISVVGFDGYTSAGTQREQRMQSEMEEFFALLQDHYPDTAVNSLLKTTYPIQQESIYAHLSAR